HLAMQIAGEMMDGREIQMTLDADIQTMAERAAKRAVRKMEGKIDNAAAIVVDVETAEVLARVGSADFFNTPGGGQVDICRAPRSPGSTLKPFTYGLAMEDNRLYAYETLLDDTWDHGLYHPENFNFKYNGLISASYALRHSLNVPAVAVLQRIGVENLHGFLRQIGLTTLTHSPDHYGLGLTLGSCEVKLEELAAAYCMLANLGEYRPLRIQKDLPIEKSVRNMSRGICLKLYEMLEQPLPAELHREAMQTVSVEPRVCWKTGTSWGLRDAWTFVFNRHYVVGVWMGNNDGRSSKRLVGAGAALPLAGEIFRSLPQKSAPAWPEIGDDLREVRICAVSGLPASDWCLHTRKVFLPRTQYLHRLCDMHYPARKDELNSTDTQTIIERWPASAQNWDLANILSPVTPRTVDHPEQMGRPKDLCVLEPSHESEYILTGELNGDRIRLRTSVDAQTELHWYVDDRYLGDSEPNRPLYIGLQTGAHRLTCMTQGGETQTICYRVLSPEDIACQ
ncbi:MAG: penicillin-binding transpeptidase domain-containing protein, partial [bacterium]